VRHQVDARCCGHLARGRSGSEVLFARTYVDDLSPPSHSMIIHGFLPGEQLRLDSPPGMQLNPPDAARRGWGGGLQLQQPVCRWDRRLGSWLPSAPPQSNARHIEVQELPFESPSLHCLVRALVAQYRQSIRYNQSGKRTRPV
jgi:hypothetical protein